MKVGKVYRPEAVYVTPADSLRDAARKMRISGQSCLPVLEGTSLVGIVSERDLVEAIANGVRPTEGLVVDYTNDGSVTVSLNDDCEVAELKMLAIGCRNLPVMSGGSLVGMVSMRDIVLKAAADAEVPSARAVAAGGDVVTAWPDEPPPDVDSEG